MRTTQKRKRSVSRFVNGKKRRLVHNRRRFKKGRYYSGTTTRSTGLANISRGGKLLTKKRWRQMLWRDTIMMTKFKSVQMSSSSQTTPAGPNQILFNISEVFSNTSPFWTGAGGCLPQVAGGSAPSLTPNKLVIRGGMMTFDVVNTDATSDIKVKMFLVYPKQQTTRLNSATRTNMPIVDWFVAMAALAPLTSATDVQDLPDYEAYYHPPTKSREVFLRPGEIASMSQKIRIKRIDADLFKEGGVAFPSLITFTCAPGGTATATFRIATGYNISFCVVDI